MADIGTFTRLAKLQWILAHRPPKKAWYNPSIV